ncbi:MAG: CHAT domain-containing protein [Pseudomonadales bacterium]|nr:CHAT domain-containing protein [Pseudomonadales bacterium]
MTRFPTSTITHAGNGRNKLCRLTALLIFALVSLQPCSLQAAESVQSLHEEWRLAAEFTLSPNEQSVLVVHQQGADLILQLRADSEPVLIQDSADDFVGSEVLLAVNHSVVHKQFELHVKNRLAAVDYDFTVEQFDDLSDFESGLANTLSEASRRWYENSRDPEILSLLSDIPLPDESSPLVTIAHWHRVELLAHTSQYEQLLDYLTNYQEQLLAGSSPITRLYYGWMLARAYRGQDRIEEALAQLDSLGVLLQSLQQESDLSAQLLRESVRGDWGLAQVLLGLKLGDQQSMHQGAEKIEMAISYSLPLNDYKLLGDLSNYLYSYQSMLGLRAEAMATLDIAESYYRRSGNLSSLATVKNNQAFNERAIGDLSAAQHNYRQALQILEQTSSYRGYATVLSRLALTYQVSGDYYRSETLFNDAIARFRDLSLGLPALQAEIELGVVYRLQSRFQEAITLQNRLLESLERDIWLDEFLRVNIELARNYLAVGNASLASQAITAIRPIRDGAVRLGVVLDAYAIDIELMYLEGSSNQARNLVATALQRIEEAKQAVGQASADILIEPEQQLDILQLLAKIELAAGNQQEAIAATDQAVELLGKVRNEMDFERQGPTWHAKTRRVIDFAAMIDFDRYLQTGEDRFLENAFTVLQSNNAINLAEARIFANRLSQDNTFDFDSERQQLWRDMLESKRRLLEASVTGFLSSDIEVNAAMAEEAYKAFVSQSDHRLFERPQPLTLDELQSRLQAGQAALLYSLADTRGHSVLVTCDDVQVAVLPGAATLEELIREVAAEYASVDGPGSRVASQMLAEHLLGGLEIPDNINSLIVESNGLLSLVPFSGLPLVQKGGQALMLDYYDLSSTPSFSLYFQTSNQQNTDDLSSRLNIAIFADPEIVVESASAANHAESDWAGTLAPLPNTAEEARAIRAYFLTGTAAVHTGSGANLENFLDSQARNSRILHVATHGFSNTRNPDFLGLYFSKSNEAGSSYLTYTDIKETRFTNELVVINGCETAAGEVLPGEGMMGLSRTFLARGAKATIATLWPVSDAASARFMAYFYDELIRAEAEPSRALRNAQLRLRRSPQYQNPFYWAAYTLDVADSTMKPVLK